MHYFEQLGLEREPFSNSPDPEFLYYSSQHIACLQELEIAVRLRRGLNVVVGEVGTGKTTLIRRFIKNMSADDSMRLHLVLDPYFKSPHAFLRMLCAQVLGEMPDRRLNVFALKEMLKKELYVRGVERDVASVLIVDEGQKMTPECLEVLRDLLNYETNNKKLLQILLFGQTELEPILKGMENLMDRVNSYMVLKPLGLKETRAMIEYRLSLSTPAGKKMPELISKTAYYAIQRATRGYPRKTVRLCHKIILNLLIRKRKRAGWWLVNSIVREEFQTGYGFRPLTAAVACSMLLLAGGLLAVRYVPEVRSMTQGIRSAVASSFDTQNKGASPFAPPAIEAKADPAELGDTPVAEDGAAAPEACFGEKPMVETETLEAPKAGNASSMTLDEYFANKKADAAKEEQAEAPVAPSMTESLNVDEAAEALGVVESMPEVVADTGLQSEPSAQQAPPAERLSSARQALSPHLEPAASGVSYELPQQLGALPIMPQESLSVIIRRIYGAYDAQNLRRVLAANPQLKNINDISVGQALVFPVIEPRERGLAQSLTWVRVAVERELAAAYGRLRAASLFGFESRLLPYIASDGALAFAVVLEKPFADSRSAEKERMKLPLALQKQSAVMMTPNPDVSLGQMNETTMNVLQAKFLQ